MNRVEVGREKKVVPTNDLFCDSWCSDPTILLKK